MAPPDSPPAASPAAKKKRGPVFWAAVVVLGGAALLWLADFTYHGIVYRETDDAYVAGHVHTVSSRLEGNVTEVLVEENQVVRAGQVLAKLDRLPFEIALGRARAALDAAQADVDRAAAAVAQAEAEHAQAQAQQALAAAQVQQSAAQLDLANVNRSRDERLLTADTRTISQAEADTTRSAADAAAANLAAAKANLAAAAARVQVGDAAIDAAKVQVKAARARVDAQREAVRDAERELSYTTIVAPTDGRIGNKNVEVGNRVQMGQALFALVEPDYWITANFKETQLKSMRAGQKVEIEIDALGGQAFTGTVDSIAPATGAEFALLPPDNATGNFTKVVQRVPVKIVFDPESVKGFESRLSPGLSAVVNVRVR